MMKRMVWISICLACAMSSLVMSQVKVAYVTTDAIMKQLPDAQDAQKQLDQFVVDWQGELNKLQQDWQKKFDDYEKRKLIMTEQRRVDAEKELRDIDAKIAEYRNKKFGQNGDMFVKQNELMKPVQDRVFKAIQDVALEEGYDYVFDKSGEILMMYANPKYDLTQKVLAKLTVVPSGGK
ncbi:MAG: OmpH family outer membrane protein [Ignavibacteriales bacterium]|nr:OmpH family outer membrane protein [Ignavibacteriales bacterium]